MFHYGSSIFCSKSIRYYYESSDDESVSDSISDAEYVNDEMSISSLISSNVSLDDEFLDESKTDRFKNNLNNVGSVNVVGNVLDAEEDMNDNDDASVTMNPEIKRRI